MSGCARFMRFVTYTLAQRSPARRTRAPGLIDELEDAEILIQVHAAPLPTRRRARPLRRSIPVADRSAPCLLDGLPHFGQQGLAVSAHRCGFDTEPSGPGLGRERRQCRGIAS